MIFCDRCGLYMFNGRCMHFDVDDLMQKQREEAGGIAGEYRDVAPKPGISEGQT